MKLKWKVVPAPTGAYRSFQRRGWPSAEDAGGEIRAHIVCEDDYAPRKIKSGSHKPLFVHVAQHNPSEETREKFGGGSFVWRRLKGECKTLAEAKAKAEEFWAKNPNF